MIEPKQPAPDRDQPGRLHRFAHDAMACTFELLLIEEDGKYAQQAAEAAFKEVDRLELELSRFLPTSDVARINTLRPGQTTRVGIDTVECLQLAARIYDATSGAFDVAFASRSHASGAGPPLLLSPKTRDVGVRVDDVRVDLGGIGKGYAVDQVLGVLRDWSIASGLIHSGQSSVLAFGRPPRDESWSIALRDPLDHGKEFGHVNLSNASLSGSGRKLHGDHIVDPRTGRAVTDKLGAWALTPSAALSDALATAFMVMSAQEVEAYCREQTEVSAVLGLQAAQGPRLIGFGKPVLRRPAEAG